jgi:hypothetical protein
MNTNNAILSVRIAIGIIAMIISMPFVNATNENSVSSIAITGKTNVNSFELRQQISVIHFTTSPLGNNYIRFAIPVKTFSADNPHIYSDFIDLLKGEQFPYIYIDLPVNNLKTNQTHQLVHLYLTITNISRPFEVETNIQLNRNGSLTLTGQRDIHLPDFAIEPPVKLMGLVKVNSDINIHFTLSFQLNQLTVIP